MNTTAAKNKGKFAKTVERIWDGIPVQDATKDLRIIIKPCDVSDAVQKDPGLCVMARACKRSFGTKKVLFLRTIAYVELPDEKGESKVERFEMSEAVQQLVRDFDKGNKIIPKGGFLLLAPSLSGRLDVQRTKKAKRDKLRREALLRGEWVKPEGSREAPHKPKEIDFEVRNGTGLVKFA